MSGSWNEASFFKGNTFIEVASCYARTDLDSAQSFEIALRVTKEYVRSKIKKGKGELVSGPGGKLERLEIKYAWLGFQDLFYLTRLHLGLPVSSLRLPPPTEPTRRILVAANYPIREEEPPTTEGLSGERRRGRRLSVKDISRSRSRGGTAPGTPLYALSRVPSGVGAGLEAAPDVQLGAAMVDITTSARGESGRVEMEEMSLGAMSLDDDSGLAPSRVGHDSIWSVSNEQQQRGGDLFYSVNGSQALPRSPHPQLYGPRLSHPSSSYNIASSSARDPSTTIPDSIFTTPPRPAPSPTTYRSSNTSSLTTRSPTTPTRQSKVYSSQPLRGRLAPVDPFAYAGSPPARQGTLTHRGVPYVPSDPPSGVSSTWQSTNPSPEMTFTSEFDMDPEVAQDPFARPPPPTLPLPLPPKTSLSMGQNIESQVENPMRTNVTPHQSVTKAQVESRSEETKPNLQVSPEDLRMIEEKQTELLRSLRQLRRLQEESKMEEMRMRGVDVGGVRTPPPPYARSGWI